MNLSLPFIERPVMTTLCMAALVIFGGYGYVRDPAGVDEAYVLDGSYELEVATERVPAGVFIRAPYDPGMERVKA